MTKKIIAACIFIGLVLFLSSYLMHEQKKDVIAGITLRLAEQETTLSNIAQTTDRDGADAVTESIVVDCKASNRNRFDTLLSNLGSLTQAELAETENLFDKCASFYAQRKALMVARMEREYNAYKQLVELLTIVDNNISVADYKVESWSQLLELEKRRSTLYSSQVTIQKDIIEALKAGETVQNDSLQTLLVEAQSVKEELIVTDKQSDELRSTLIDL